MTIYQRSVRAWVIGGLLGGVAGLVSARKRNRSQAGDAFWGAALGTVVVGSFTDKYLESQPGYTG